MFTFINLNIEDRASIVRKGGIDKIRADRKMREWLDTLPLSQEAIDVIADTALDAIAETFYHCFTPKDVEDACQTM